MKQKLSVILLFAKFYTDWSDEKNVCLPLKMQKQLGEERSSLKLKSLNNNEVLNF